MVSDDENRKKPLYFKEKTLATNTGNIEIDQSTASSD
jgi:hypothetical protein